MVEAGLVDNPGSLVPIQPIAIENNREDTDYGVCAF